MAKLKSDCTPEEWALYIAQRMAYKKRWVEQNRERVNEQARRARRADPSKHRAAGHRHYLKHREQILDRLKAQNTLPEKQERRRQTWRAYTARPERKESRRKIDAQPHHIQRRRRYAQTPNALKRAAERIKERVEMEPALRKRWNAYGRQLRTGFTQEMVDAFLLKQGNACAICKRSFTDKVKFQADHCHETKTPRGLLCFHCNTAEGHLRAVGLSALEFGQRLHDYFVSSTVK